MQRKQIIIFTNKITNNIIYTNLKVDEPDNTPIAHIKSIIQKGFIIFKVIVPITDE